MNIRFKLAGLAAIAAALPALADVKINDTFSVSGYAIGAGTTTDPDTGGSGRDTLGDSGSSNLDAIKFAILGKYEVISGKASLFYVPNMKSDSGKGGILDAYATYTAGPVAVTGGKFLSYLGYEAFDPVNMNQLTYGSTIAAVPAYHTGAKVDYRGEVFTLGFAAVDSLFPGSGFFQGDGDYSDEIAYEAIATYTGVKGLTLFFGYGYDNTDGIPGKNEVFDFWASYALTDKLTIAGEYDTMTDAFDAWLGFVQYNFGGGFSTIVRVSSINFDLGDTGTYTTVAPTFAFNANFSLRAEVSYADSAEGGATSVGSKGWFYGVQAVFKF